MNVKYEHKGELTLIGFSATIAPGEGFEKCPKFWDEEYNRKYARLWQTGVPQNDVEQALLTHQIGMYAACLCSGNGFEYWIAGEYKGGRVPEGLKLCTLPESDWAVFTAHGPLPGSLQSLNMEIWQSWLPQVKDQYEVNGDNSIEYYTVGDQTGPDYECGMWVPIRKKA